MSFYDALERMTWEAVDMLFRYARAVPESRRTWRPAEQARSFSLNRALLVEYSSYRRGTGQVGCLALCPRRGSLLILLTGGSQRAFPLVVPIPKPIR